MKFSKERLSSKNRVVIALIVLLVTLLTVTPALANSSNWSFTGTTTGNIVNGASNGVFHTMTAGTMRLSGNI